MQTECMNRVAYSNEEKQILAATAEKMKGLRVTQYADRAATKQIREGVVQNAIVTFPKGMGVSAVVLEGFISFERDGEYILTCPESEGAVIFLHEGEHHLRAGKCMEIKAKAGTQYGIKLTADGDGEGEDQTLRLLVNGETNGFSVAVGRILLEHPPVSLRPILDIPIAIPLSARVPTGTTT